MLGTDFVTTDWSALIAARHRSEQPGAEAFERLFASYRPAIVDFVERKFHLPPTTAEDLVQHFIVERPLERNLLTKADRSGGKFRALGEAAWESSTKRSRIGPSAGSRSG